MGSRLLNYKSLVRNCLSIISTPFPTHARDICVGGEAGSFANEALTFAFPEIGRSTKKAANKLLVMLMELDSSRNNADMKGLITRGDGVRTSTMEIIVDQLTYDKDSIGPFLEAFAEPKLKAEIVLHFFRKYIAKACLALPNQELLEVISNSTAESPSSPLKELSNNVVSAFKSIQSIDESIEIIPIGKEALFAAATILTA